MSLTAYWRFIFGAILAFLVIVAPGGITGVVSSMLKKEKSGP
jgi:ABC-type branched-subunit amino acid transport system permease subunit